MFAKRLLASLAVLWMGSGCIIHEDGSDGYAEPLYPGDVTFTWSFSGLGCAERPEIRSVRLRIPGEVLVNDGVYPCSVNGYPGITLHDFAPGTYGFSVETLGYDGGVLDTGGGTFVVNGSVRVSADLTPVGGPSSYAYLTWRFPASDTSPVPTCSQAGVSWVEVSIDGATPVRFPCESGRSDPGVQTGYLAPGMHTVELYGLASDGYPYYRFRGTLQTYSGAPVSAEYFLDWNVGGVALKWQLTNGSLAQTCQQAGVQTLWVNFLDSEGHWVYGQDGDPQDCDAAPIVYNFLLPGTYRVYIQGTGPGGTYLSNAQHPAVVTVVAGRFVDEFQAVSVQLFRAN